MNNKIKIKPPFIKLGNALKLANIIESGGMAKNIILDGLVLVNGEVCTQRGKKIFVGDIITIENETFEVVE